MYYHKGTWVGLDVKSCLFLMKLEFSLEIFKKKNNKTSKFHENLPIVWKETTTTTTATTTTTTTATTTTTTTTATASLLPPCNIHTQRRTLLVYGATSPPN